MGPWWRMATMAPMHHHCPSCHLYLTHVGGLVTSPIVGIPATTVGATTCLIANTLTTSTTSPTLHPPSDSHIAVPTFTATSPCGHHWWHCHHCWCEDDFTSWLSGCIFCSGSSAWVGSQKCLQYGWPLKAEDLFTEPAKGNFHVLGHTWGLTHLTSYR